VHLPDEARRIVESRQALLQDKAAISKQIDQADAEIKAFMGEHETGRVGNYRVTWKAFHRKSYTVAESDGRTLRITEENSNGNH
jgi:predicted phage-related endonuclease